MYILERDFIINADEICSSLDTARPIRIKRHADTRLVER